MSLKNFAAYGDLETVLTSFATRIKNAVGRKGTGTNSEIFNDYTRNTASGNYARAEGYRTAAGANCSHAEGSTNTISSAATCSHVEGFDNTVSGNTSHAEGAENTVSGTYSHAEGIGNIISGSESHVEGFHNLVYSDNQHVQGKYNVADSNDKYAFIIGNGTTDDTRSNAFAVDWNGLIYINNAATGVNLATLASTITSLESRLSALENAGFLTSSDLPSMTQAQYDALQTKDKPYYFIVEE